MLAMLVGKQLFESVGGFCTLLVAERRAGAHRAEGFLYIDIPARCLVVGNDAAIIADSIVVEVATPSGDESFWFLPRAKVVLVALW